MICYGIDIMLFDDIMLFFYIVDVGKGGNGMDEFFECWFGYKLILFKEVCGFGKLMIIFDKVVIDKVIVYVVEDVDVILCLWQILKLCLVFDWMVMVYEMLEWLMLLVLVCMEKCGILVDWQMLLCFFGDFV